MHNGRFVKNVLVGCTICILLGGIVYVIAQPITAENISGPPWFMIWKPNHSLYIANRQVLPLPINISIIIGKITCKASATWNGDGSINYVEWRLDGKVVKICNKTENYSYVWEWYEKATGYHIVEATAYFVNGSVVSDEEKVLIYNL
ncbi:MAG: hypothetical protein U9O96_01080 [Candidatus Thermoplasmatota archaeon]|nr:hypothetical protein [Candidatus Thermoplasmatota archaeon]